LAVGTVAEIKSRLPVLDVVGETVTLKKAGSTYKGLCPFHGEKTASFVVTPARETWHCFGCGLGGDVFSFVMQRDSIGFGEALKVLAAKAGVELDERTRRDDARRARLREVMESAVAFYHAVLTGAKAGGPALDYLRGRGFTDETIARHQLGWAPDGWDSMIRRVTARRDIRVEELTEVGLTTAGRRGPIDRFRSRVIFPIRDQNGAAVGLGGRLLEGDGPKYLNSPATPLFDKSRTLYLIDRAKATIRKTEQVVIVEGYTDALMAHQAGFDNVVASLGTALTPGQVALVTRYAKRIALAYDVDPAGEKAGTFGVRALEDLIPQLAASGTGVEVDEVRVVRLPDGKDPDEVLRDEPDRWREEVRTAQPIVDFLIDHYAGEYELRSPGGRARFVDALVPTLRRLPPVMYQGYEQKIHQVSGVEEWALREALRAAPSPQPGSQSRITAEAVVAAADALPVDEILRGVGPEEADLLRLMLFVSELQPRVLDELRSEDLTSTVARELYRAIAAQRDPGADGRRPPFDRTGLLAGLDDETRALALALYAKDGPNPADLPADRQQYAVDKVLIELEAERLEDLASHTRSEMADAERTGDRDAIARLDAVERDINDRRRSLDRRRDQTRLLARPVAGRA
jgi:DNA primase